MIPVFRSCDGCLGCQRLCRREHLSSSSTRSTLPVASACGALMEMCFMLSVIAVKRNCSLCELLGMNANVPTDICFSFAGLMRRGGATGPHRDGWGIALYEGKGCRTFHDPKPSAHSEIARFIREYPIKSRITEAGKHIGLEIDVTELNHASPDGPDEPAALPLDSRVTDGALGVVPDSESRIHF